MIESIALAQVILSRASKLPSPARTAKDARGTAVERLLAWQEALIIGKQGDDKGYSTLKGDHFRLARLVCWELALNVSTDDIRCMATISCALARLRRRLSQHMDVLPMLVAMDAHGLGRYDRDLDREVRLLLKSTFSIQAEDEQAEEATVEMRMCRVEAVNARSAFERILLDGIRREAAKTSWSSMALLG
jgi:hypothetical protein